MIDREAIILKLEKQASILAKGLAIRMAFSPQSTGIKPAFIHVSHTVSAGGWASTWKARNNFLCRFHDGPNILTSSFKGRQLQPHLSVPRLVFIDCSRRTLKATGDSVPSSRTSEAPLKTKLTNTLNLATNLFPLWVVLGAIFAFVRPSTFLWFQPSYIVPTLALVMLGMGLTLSPSSFLAVRRAPRLVVLGAFAQYTTMPTLAWIISRTLSLPPPLAAGVILVGVCPGGAASNVVCLLAGADVALSVVLTLVSTVAAVLFIPLLMKILAGAFVPVRAVGLLVSTAQVVLGPLILGATINRLFPRIVSAVSALLPLFSVIGVTMICGGVVAANAASLAKVGPALITAIALMHAFGGVLGYVIARIAQSPDSAARTISIEVMMQNSSLAVSLAHAHFANPLTAVPGAISATMHSVFGSLLAGFWRIMDARKRTHKTQSPPH